MINDGLIMKQAYEERSKMEYGPKILNNLLFFVIISVPLESLRLRPRQVTAISKKEKSETVTLSFLNLRKNQVRKLPKDILNQASTFGILECIS